MIKYKLFSAGGNITALVKNASQNHDLSVLAKQILLKEPKVEQVGFIFASSGNKEDFYLKMMGGELCINAARSAAFDYCKQNKTNRTKFKISGTNSIIKANLKNDEMELSLPESLIISNSKVKKGYLVNMKGIRFIVADATNLN
ncbi:hypothetical protein KGQ24_02830, partial [Patescibacteria group bacterium]|nr:hypothetical protein [Patescibacteria group bacterium]